MSLQDEMREWLLECFSSDDDQDIIEDLDDVELVSAINRYFGGGMKGFLQCHAISNWDMVEA